MNCAWQKKKKAKEKKKAKQNNKTPKHAKPDSKETPKAKPKPEIRVAAAAAADKAGVKKSKSKPNIGEAAAAAEKASGSKREARADGSSAGRFAVSVKHCKKYETVWSSAKMEDLRNFGFSKRSETSVVPRFSPDHPK